MDINARCPFCHEALAISENEVDLLMNCPMCHKTFVWGEILRAKEQERRAGEERKRQLRAEYVARQREIWEKRKKARARRLRIKREAVAMLEEHIRSVSERWLGVQSEVAAKMRAFQGHSSETQSSKKDLEKERRKIAEEIFNCNHCEIPCHRHEPIIGSYDAPVVFIGINPRCVPSGCPGEQPSFEEFLNWGTWEALKRRRSDWPRTLKRTFGIDNLNDLCELDVFKAAGLASKVSNPKCPMLFFARQLELLGKDCRLLILTSAGLKFLQGKFTGEPEGQIQGIPSWQEMSITGLHGREGKLLYRGREFFVVFSIFPFGQGRARFNKLDGKNGCPPVTDVIRKYLL
jgi:hypothetical protein